MSGKLSDKATSAWTGLLRAGQGVLGSVEADLKAAGLPPLVWYDVLLELDRAEDGRLRHRDIHRRMLLERYNVTRLVERLEREGLVAQEPCLEDARGTYVRITAAGRDLRRRMWKVYSKAIRTRFADRFTEAELGSLASLLGRLRSG